MTRTYRQQLAIEFADRIHALGFRVWIAERGTYGIISDDTGARVMTWSMEDQGSLGGYYNPPSQQSGTGWRLDESPDALRTAEDVRKALYAYPPQWVRKGWKHLTTLEQHLAQYGPSSRYHDLGAKVTDGDTDEASHLFLCATNEGDAYPTLCAMGDAAFNTPDSTWAHWMRDYARRLLREKRIDAWPSAATINLAAAMLRDHHIAHAAERARIKAEEAARG